MKILPRAGTAGMLWSRILTFALGVRIRADGTDRMKSFVSFAGEPGAGTRGVPSHARSGRLFRKYAATFVIVVCLTLVVDESPEIWFSYQEYRVLLARIEQQEAQFAAEKIDQFVKEIEAQMAWVTPLPWNAVTFE